MDGREIVVSFSLDEEEARRETEDVATNEGAPKLTRWSMRIAAIGWLASGCLQIAGNYRSGSGWWTMASAIFYGVATLSLQLKLRKVAPGVETIIRFSEAGISFERPAARSLPWDAVRSIRRSRTAYFLKLDCAAIAPPLEPDVVIPLRALGESRIALWDLAGLMMLGPLRPVSAQLSMVRSGGLRRNDAGSIRNYEALRRKSVNPA